MRHNKMCQIRPRLKITWFFVLFAGIAPFSSWISAVAHADELSQSQKELSDGYRKYYQKLRNSSEPLTPEQREQARRETVDPARKKYGETLRKERREVARREMAKRRLSGKSGRLLKGKGQGRKVSAGEKSPRVSVPPASRPRYESRQPEVVIDGANVPREIEFPGKKTE